MSVLKWHNGILKWLQTIWIVQVAATEILLSTVL